MKKTKLGLVLVNFQNANDTIECLCSIFKAVHGPDIVFLIDNCSLDGSVEKIRHFSETGSYPLIIHSLSQNFGYGEGCNFGMRASLEQGCSHIVVMNNDTIVETEFFTVLRESINLYPQFVVAANIRDINTGKPSWGVGYLDQNSLELKHDFSEKKGKNQSFTFVSGCFLSLPRELIESVGLFDHRYFMYYEDVDLSYRIIKAGYKIQYVPKLILKHKVSSTTMKISINYEYYTRRNTTFFIMKHGSLILIGKHFLFTIFLICKKLFTFRNIDIILTPFLHALLGKMGKR